VAACHTAQGAVRPPDRWWRLTITLLSGIVAAMLVLGLADVLADVLATADPVRWARATAEARHRPACSG